MAYSTAPDLHKHNDSACQDDGPYVTTPGRSRNMAAIRRANTKPEVALRSALHSAGYRYRVDFRVDLGEVKPRPDMVFTRLKVAVFVDGCFWHCCPEHGKPPSHNTGYWIPKLAKNIERDRLYDQALTANGWMVLRIWEHESLTDAAERVIAAVDSRATKGRARRRHRQ